MFSKDDCAEYGFNVQEAKALEKLGGFVKTGADEIPLTLLARAIQMIGRYEDSKKSNYQKNSLSSCPLSFLPSIKIAPIFLAPEYKDLISNYEDVSIEKSVLGQLELAGCEVCEPDKADILLYVNNFEHHQGEIVMKVDTKPFSGEWVKPDKPYMIADVRFANGADNAFVEKVLEKGFDENFCGYSAWNTSANTLGSLICGAKMYWQQNKSSLDGEDLGGVQQLIPTPTLPNQGRSFLFFKKLQAIRLLDDWAYQANVRQQLEKPDINLLKEKMKPYEERVFKFLGVKFDVEYKFPWNRLFEVEVELS